MIFGVRRVVSNNVTLYILKVCVCESQTKHRQRARLHSVFRLRVYGRMGLNGEFKLLSFVSTSEVYTFKDNYFCFLWSKHELIPEHIYELLLSVDFKTYIKVYCSFISTNKSHIWCSCHYCTVRPMANSGSDVIVHFPAFDLIWSFLKENGTLAYIVWLNIWSQIKQSCKLAQQATQTAPSLVQSDERWVASFPGGIFGITPQFYL